MRPINFTTLALCVFAIPSLAGEPSVYQIGVPQSAFRDVSPGLRSFAGQPFQDLVKQQTGLTSKMVMVDDAWTVAKGVEDGTFQLAVLQGHEFAWVREKYPELQPLVCSIYRQKEIHAVVLVRHDCKADGVNGLKGSKVAMSGSLKDHARLFFEKQKDLGLEATCSVDKTKNTHEAIQKVLDGQADVTLADGAEWAHFQSLYPGPAQNIKVIAKSDCFPNTVLVYKKGAVSEAVLKKFRDGFLTAHEIPKAARMMGMNKIERFADIPADYDDRLKACLKAYPKPLEERK